MDTRTPAEKLSDDIQNFFPTYSHGGLPQTHKALELAQKYHKGLRKDGVTPEFAHQVFIAGYIRDIWPLNLDDILAAAFLHDLLEDYDYSLEELQSQFDPYICSLVWLLTKKYKGVVKSPEEYYSFIAVSYAATLIKSVDRIHNLHTMVGVFSDEKQRRYVEETEKYIIPMLESSCEEASGRTLRNALTVLNIQLTQIKARLGM